MPQPPPPGNHVTLRGSFDTLYMLANAHARCVMPFLRVGMGTGSLGWYAIAAGVFLYYGAHLAEDQFFLNYFGVWLVLVVLHKFFPGKNRHSHYSGQPLASFFLSISENTSRLIIEPLMCCGAGLALAQWSMPLGKLVGMAACSLMLIERLDRAAYEKKVQAILDAQMESEFLSSAVRERRGY